MVDHLILTKNPGIDHSIVFIWYSFFKCLAMVVLDSTISSSYFFLARGPVRTIPDWSSASSIEQFTVLARCSEEHPLSLMKLYPYRLS